MPRSKWSTTRLDVVGVAEAAKILGVDRRTIARWSETGSGTNGPSRTYMPPWATVGKTRIWTRADITALADLRRDRVATQKRLEASVRRQLTREPSSLSVEFIAWKNTPIAVLSAARNDGTGVWSVQPSPTTAERAPAVLWRVGDNRTRARKAAIDLLTKRLAKDIAAGVDPLGPGGFLTLAQLASDPEKPSSTP